MSEQAIPATAQSARRLAITKQHLAGEVPVGASPEHLLRVVQDLAFVQWDPISIVAPSHILSLWSRIGGFRVQDLDALLWREKQLFLTWTPIASIVPMDDFPLHHSLMQRYPDSLSDSWGSQRERARKFLADHKALRKAALSELEDGPKLLTEFRNYVRTGRSSDGWTPGNALSVMLSYLLMTGDVMVVGHEGNQNLWGLSEQFLPKRVERREMAQDDMERTAAQRAIQALGTATPREIHYYFPRGRYLNLKQALERLQEEGAVHRVLVSGIPGKQTRFVHDADVSLLEAMTTDAWRPRTTLLAPFDNLISGRERTSHLFGFDYVHEQFVPKSKRKFGTYVLPILWGDRLIGRVDPLMDREKKRLVINSVHAEPGAPTGKEVASEIAETIARLATFLGAREVAYSTRVPPAWKGPLR